MFIKKKTFKLQCTILSNIMHSMERFQEVLHRICDLSFLWWDQIGTFPLKINLFFMVIKCYWQPSPAQFYSPLYKNHYKKNFMLVSHWLFTFTHLTYVFFPNSNKLLVLHLGSNLIEIRHIPLWGLSYKLEWHFCSNATSRWWSGGPILVQYGQQCKGVLFHSGSYY